MSIFSDILDKLGIHKPAPQSTAAPTGGGFVPGGPRPVTSTPGAPAAPAAPGVFAGTGVPAPMAMVDVVSKLDKLAGSNSGLDWKVSIVDLLKLLGMESSLDFRKKLATELACPADLMSDSAKMNTWLIKTVLQKISENGGNIPANLLH